MVKTQKIINYVQNAAREADPCGRYGVDYFLTGTGLDINPHYSRLGLGTHLLLTRYLNVLKLINIFMIHGIS